MVIANDQIKLKFLLNKAKEDKSIVDNREETECVLVIDFGWVFGVFLCVWFYATR